MWLALAGHQGDVAGSPFGSTGLHRLVKDPTANSEPPRDKSEGAIKHRAGGRGGSQALVWAEGPTEQLQPPHEEWPWHVREGLVNTSVNTGLGESSRGLRT